MIKKIFYYIYYPVRAEPLFRAVLLGTEPVAPLFGAGTEPREPSPSLLVTDKPSVRGWPEMTSFKFQDF